MKSLNILSCLLDYPSESLWQAKDELTNEVAQLGKLTDQQKIELTIFIQHYFSMPLLDAQAIYYETFDASYTTSLLLFEHVHGDSKERGQAMVDLIDQYQQNGVEITEKQLPDYLPLFLEYLSILPDDECQKWLSYIALIIRLISLRLAKKSSQFEILFNILYQLSQQTVDDDALKNKVKQEPLDNTAEALDKIWQEEQVLFQGQKQHINPKNNETYYINVGEDKRSKT